jgi:hypothetical protein
MAGRQAASGGQLIECLKGFFCQASYASRMTFSEIIAWAFWPIVGIFVVSLLAMRGHTGLRHRARIDHLNRDMTPYLGPLDRIIDSGPTPAEETRLRWTRRLIGAGFGIVFFVYMLVLFYWQSSIAGVMDFHILLGMLGLFGIGGGVYQSCNGNKTRLSKGRLIVALLFFAFLIWTSASTLYGDYAEPRLVLEGQVHNVREERGYRTVKYLADIGGHTVNVTTPIFEHLKSKPYVRVEVGRGSNYIFDIEYLK